MAGFSKLLREGCAGVEESLRGRFTRGGAANARKRERDTETQLKEHHARLTAESKAASARLMQPRGHATPTTAPIAQTPYWPKSATISVGVGIRFYRSTHTCVGRTHTAGWYQTLINVLVCRYFGYQMLTGRRAVSACPSIDSCHLRRNGRHIRTSLRGGVRVRRRIDIARQELKSLTQSLTTRFELKRRR